MILRHNSVIATAAADVAGTTAPPPPLLSPPHSVICEPATVATMKRRPGNPPPPDPIIVAIVLRMRALLSCLVIVSIAACDRGTKRRVEPTPEPKPAHDSIKTQGAPCYDGKPEPQTETSPARESGRAGSFDGSTAQVRREPCTDAGTP